MAAIVVRPMIEYASEVETIAGWFYEEWRSLYSTETQASVQRRIESWCTHGKVPTALIAVSEGHVIGTVALKEHELRQCAYSPWLAGLFVVPAFRRQGVGELLVRAAESEAEMLGVEELYLYTPESQSYYERLGWSVIEQHQVPSGLVAVMSKALKPFPSSGQPTVAAEVRR